MARDIVRPNRRHLGVLIDALAQLGKTRKDWATASGVSQTAISNFLGGKSGVAPERLGGLLAVLADWVDGGHGASLAEPQRNALRANLQAVRQAGGLVPKDADVFAPPVGALPTDARNRIPRKCDDEALATLDRHPFAMSVFGPPMAGKSTVLNLVVEKAREQGFRVSRLDCGCVVGGEIFFELAQVVAEDLCLEPPKGSSLSPMMFGRWLPSQCRASPMPQPGLLVFENLAALGHEDMGRMLAIIRALNNRRGETNLSMIVELGTRGPEHSKVLEESRAHFFPRVEVGWFTEEDFRALTKRYGLEHLADSGWDQIADYVGGQPTLVQRCLWRLYRGVTMDALVAELGARSEKTLNDIVAQMSTMFASTQLPSDDSGSHRRSAEAHFQWWGLSPGQIVPKYLSKVFGGVE